MRRNQWPASLLHMRNTITAAIGALSHLTQQLLCSFAQGLKLPADAFQPWLQPQPIYNLRLLHYPSDHQRDCSNTFGIAPHSDYGLITLVAQEKVSGLQVRTPCGTDWIDVEPIPGSLVLNTADSLTRLTNGRLLSTPHRVINSTKKERYSAAFFLSPALDVPLKPLKELCQHEPAAFDEITYRQYIQQILKNNYGRDSD